MRIDNVLELAKLREGDHLDTIIVPAESEIRKLFEAARTTLQQHAAKLNRNMWAKAALCFGRMVVHYPAVSDLVPVLI